MAQTDAQWRAALKYRYKMTPEQYDELLSRQDGKCAICREGEGWVDHRLSIDHDHETGVVRGLLCKACNAFLGLADDDPNRLMAAVAYLLEREV